MNRYIVKIQIERRRNMMKSMTGFGRSEVATDCYKIVIEIKSVNHRYCDWNIKMPKKLSFFESNIRTLLKQYIKRGKVDIFITYEEYEQTKECVRYNKEIASEYIACFKQMEEEFGIENDITVSKLSQYPDVLTLEEQAIDEEQLWSKLEAPLKEAACKLVETRQKEGKALQQDLIKKLEYMSELVQYVQERSPQLIEEYRNKLEIKVKELLESSAIEESRIVAEVTMYADKVCVDEEIVRLKSHIETTKEVLLSNEESIGRKLDFIAQEMNREANTILSKASDIEISNQAIVLKTEIEKVREQIQNIE